MGQTATDPEVLLDPAPASWPALVRGVPTDGVARDTRAALGLPTDRPVVMAGHQPGFWHPGILAKWFAAAAIAHRVGGSGAWVVVDQSPGAGAALNYPALDDRGPHAALARHTLLLGDPDIPAASQPPAQPEPKPEAAAATDAVGAGLERITGAMKAHMAAPNLARQLHAAALEILGPDLQLPAVFVTDLHRAPGFAELAAAMRADPEGCARHYNEAARAFAHAGVRELAIGDGAAELPLWERPDGPAPWSSVRSDRLADLPDGQLVLRGIPMTGLLRWRACDLFIHGTGGGASHTQEGYDRVTERWLARWLGVRDLAPAVVASATMRLDFGDLGADIPDPDEIARAQELAHRAAHDPSLLGNEALGARKRELAREIAALPRGSDRRAELFDRMQALREQAKRSNADRLAELRAEAERLSARAEEADIVADRTWPWAIFPDARINELRAAIESSLA